VAVVAHVLLGLLVLVDRAVAALGAMTLEYLQLPEQQTLAAVVVVGGVLPTSLRQVAQVLSSSVTQTHLMTLLLQQALHPLATLVDIKFTHGPGLVQSHSEVAHGSLCTT